MSQFHFKSRPIYGHRNSGQLCQFYGWGINLGKLAPSTPNHKHQGYKKRISKSLTLNFVSNEAHLGFKL